MGRGGALLNEVRGARGRLVLGLARGLGQDLITGFLVACLLLLGQVNCELLGG